MSQISDLLAALEAKAETVKDEIVQAAETLGAEIINDLEVGAELLALFAINAILTEAPKLISGQEKFGNAVTSVVQSVEAAGMPIVIADGQALVQNAYNYNLDLKQNDEELLQEQLVKLKLAALAGAAQAKNKEAAHAGK